MKTGYRFTSIIYSCLLLALLAGCSRQPSYPAPPVKGRQVAIDASSLRSEEPQFFTYQYQGKNISFFVLKLNNTVNAYFDACATCYPHKQGYRSDDGVVTCRYCNMRFSLYKLEKGIGGCFPIKINGRLENGKYLIPLDLLEAEAGKF